MHHQLGKAAGCNVGMPGHKAGDAVLHLVKVAHGLRHPQHGSAVAHRVHHHGCGGHDKAAPGTDCQRNANGMSAAQHQRCAGLAHPGDQLGQRKPGLNIAAHGVQHHHQAIDGGVFLNIHDLRDHLFIACGFLIVGCAHMAFDLAHHRQAVDRVSSLGVRHRCGFTHILQFLIFFFCQHLLCRAALCLFWHNFPLGRLITAP